MSLEAKKKNVRGGICPIHIMLSRLLLLHGLGLSLLLPPLSLIRLLIYF